MSSNTASQNLSTASVADPQMLSASQPTADFFAAEAFEIRQALSKLRRTRRNSPYPKKIRKRIVSYIRLRRPQLGWKAIAKELAIPQSTITTWGEAFASKNIAAKTLPAMLPVKVVDLTDAASIGDPESPAIASHFANEASSSGRCYSVQNPAGYRLLGLSYAEACSLFRSLP